MAWKKFPPYSSYGAYSFVAYALTNYKQLLLYISYDKNSLYMFVTSKCLLVPLYNYILIVNILQLVSTLSYHIALNYGRSHINAWSCLVTGGNSIITKRNNIINYILTAQLQCIKIYARSCSPLLHVGLLPLQLPSF